MTADVGQTMDEIVAGRLSDAEIEKFLLDLRRRGETAFDIFSAAKVMRRVAVKLTKNYPGLLDTCGTGGDSRNTINVSTLAAITACAAGATVAKHGNRSVSSVCGSADLLELFGVRIELPVEAVERMIEQTGFGFFFAPDFHPATRFAMPARRRIQGKTIFNLIGPLANPAGAQFQLLGVYEARLVPVMAAALVGLGIKKALVVHGEDGMDEISLTGKTHVAEIRHALVNRYTVVPEDFGLKRCALADLQCATKEENKEAAIAVLRGGEGPKTEIVCLNAGAALYAAEKALSIQQGISMARTALAEGAAFKKLNEIIRFSKEAAA